MLKAVFTFLILLYSVPSYADAYAADEKWYIMIKFGKCSEIAKIAEEKPELKNIKTPEEFSQKLKKNGGTPVVDRKLESQGYVNISTSYGKKSLTFSKAKNCKTIIGAVK